jgi:hypothetical protein
MEFSRRFLGKGSSYLTSMSARDRQVSDEVFEHLANELERANEQGMLQVEDLEAQLTSLLRQQKHRAEILDWTIANRQRKADDALDALLEDTRDDGCSLFDRLLRRAGLVSAG